MIGQVATPIGVGHASHQVLGSVSQLVVVVVPTVLAQLPFVPSN